MHQLGKGRQLGRRPLAREGGCCPRAVCCGSQSSAAACSFRDAVRTAVYSAPLDFEGVNPQAKMLRNGRIQAPTGEVIRVKLKRVSGE